MSINNERDVRIEAGDNERGGRQVVRLVLYLLLARFTVGANVALAHTAITPFGLRWKSRRVSIVVAVVSAFAASKRFGDLHLNADPECLASLAFW
jgi:hypothetical protein